MDKRNLSVTTVILAGGQGKRIGGNKGLQSLAGKPLLMWVMEAVKNDSAEVLINANNLAGEYKAFGCPVIEDELSDWQGPLAGLHVALLTATNDCVMTVPCDTPYLPTDLIARLLHSLASNKAEAAVVMAGGARQPTIVLYQKSVLPKLLQYLASGNRKVNDWLNTLQLNEVYFDDTAGFDNINTREELERAAEMQKSLKLGNGR